MIRKVVEKRIRKLQTGKVLWLPEVQDLQNKITLRELILKKKKKGKVSSRRITELRKLTGIWTAQSDALETIEVELQKAYDNYNTAKKNTAEDLRDHFLDNHAIELAKKNGTTVENERKKLNTIKFQQKTAKNVKNAQTN